MRVLVTGATGFVGSNVVARLSNSAGYSVRAVSRRPHAGLAGIDTVRIADIADHRGWSTALQGCAAVVHSAARVHVLDEAEPDPLTAFRRTNVVATEQIAREAAAAGAKRFVYLSSVKVLGDFTEPAQPFKAFDSPRPKGPYAISKFEAEQVLRTIEAETGLEVVIIRPVLVYGPGAGANFLSMMRALEKRWPLPLAAVKNRRSLVAVENLSDLIVRCLGSENSGGQTFMVSDGEDLSTPDLLKRLGKAMGVEPRLYRVPERILEAGARLLGKQEHARRLLGSLQVDIAHTRETLGWAPCVTVDHALCETATHYWNHQAR